MKRKQVLARTSYHSKTESKLELTARQKQMESEVNENKWYCCLHERDLNVQEVRRKHCYINLNSPYVPCKYAMKKQR